MITALTHSRVSKCPLSESWRIVDDIMKGVAKNQRLVKIALAVAEMLLSLVFTITSKSHEANVPLVAGQDSITSTVHHIFTLHKRS